tara:strand:- start:141 stop:485 length:345 start_codon:yes stop_codon:yes gene_type:complete
MENIMSGSIGKIDMLTDEEIDESLEMLMGDSQFEQDLINSFNTQMYIVNSKGPNPIWTFCSVSMKMIPIYHKTEVTVLDELDYKQSLKANLIECLVGINLVKIPKEFINSGEWH